MSHPQGPTGVMDASTSTSTPPRRQLPRSAFKRVLVPVSILALAGLFFVYSRTTVQAAKVNAKRHREADGGSINWRNESLRRHGVLKKPEERTLLQQLVAGTEDEKDEATLSAARDARRKEEQSNFVEESLRKARETSRRRNRED